MTLMSSATTPVAFLDLAALHQPLRAELDAVWAETLATSGFIARRWWCAAASGW